MSIKSEEWADVWNATCKLTADFNEVILIGGVAVYMHMMNGGDQLAQEAEFSHDVDTYISLSDFADIRDLYVVTPNKRLNKHQVEIGRVEIDLYVQHGHRLAVPYDEMSACAITYGTIKVASLEHLLILKLDAAEDRWSSAKGDKDRRDVAKIGWMLSDHADKATLIPYLNAQRLNLLRQVERSTAFIDIARGNAHKAKAIREAYTLLLDEFRDDAYRQPTPRF